MKFLSKKTNPKTKQTKAKLNQNPPRHISCVHPGFVSNGCLAILKAL